MAMEMRFSHSYARLIGMLNGILSQKKMWPQPAQRHIHLTFDTDTSHIGKIPSFYFVILGENTHKCLFIVAEFVMSVYWKTPGPPCREDPRFRCTQWSTVQQ